MRLPLAPLEERVYRYLLDFLAEHTFQPSVRDIGRACRVPSTKTVTDLLAVLEQKGYLEREKGRSRGVRLVGWQGPAGAIPVPLVRPRRADDGAATTPDATLRAHEAAIADAAGLVVERHVTLDATLLPGADVLLVRLDEGDASLQPGDLVLVHPSARAEEGATVAVRVGDRVLGGALRRRGGTLAIERGPAVAPLEVAPGADAAVLGPVVGVWRGAATTDD